MEPKAVVSSFFERWSSGEIESAFALVRDDAKWWVPGNLPFSGWKSKSEYLQVVASIRRGFPDGLRLELQSMIAEGGTVAAEVKGEGEHVNGKKYANKYHFLITVENGQMTEIKEYMDTLHLFQLIR